MAERLATRVALIGAGPAGIGVACELARRGIAYAHFEKGEIGATIAWFPPRMVFHTSPEQMQIDGAPLATTFPGGATREDYLAYLRKLVADRGLAVRTGEEVLSLTPGDGGFRLRTRGSRGETEVEAERVVLAIGNAAAPRRLGIPGEDLPHVSCYFDAPEDLAGQRVLVIGGRFSALEAVRRCFAAGAKVTQSYRGAELALPGPIGRLDSVRVLELAADRRVDVLFRTRPVQIEAGRAWLRHADGSVRPVEADRVYVLTGYQADLGLLERAGGSAVQPVRDWQTLESDVPGLHLAGAAVGPRTDDPRLISAIPGQHRRLGACFAGEPVPPVDVPYWLRPRRKAERAAVAPDPAPGLLRRATRGALDALRR